MTIFATGSEIGSRARPNWFVANFYSIFFILALIVFSGIWYYPQSGVISGAEELEAPYAVPFRYAFWLLAIFSVSLHLARHSLRSMVRSFGVFLPGICAGAVSSIFGIQPSDSLRLLIFWFVMALSAATLAGELPVIRFRRLLTLMLIFELSISILIVFAIPSIGQMASADGAWRGAFVGKNILGWVSSISLVFVFLVRRDVSVLRSILLALLSVGCLIGSQSKGALVICACTIGFGQLIGIVNRSRLSPGLAASVVIGTLLATGSLVVLAWSSVTELLGRDETLTGRTYIWSVYFESMLDGWFLGSGPGAFTLVSPITITFKNLFADLGNIYTPHSMYLGVFGDGGIVGFLCLIVSLSYLAFYLPFRERTVEARHCACMALLLMLGGLVETHNVYSFSIEGFVLIALLGYAQRSKSRSVGFIEGVSEQGPQIDSPGEPHSALRRSGSFSLRARSRAADGGQH